MPARATLEQKIAALDYLRANGKSQVNTVEKFKDTIAILTLLLSEWVKNEAELRKRFEEDSPYARQAKRRSSYKYEDINNAMLKFVQDQRAAQQPVNETVLRAQWSKLAHKYGVRDPKRLAGFSHGWLAQFKKRVGLDRRTMSHNTFPRQHAGGSQGSEASSEASSASPHKASSKLPSSPRGVLLPRGPEPHASHPALDEQLGPRPSELFDASFDDQAPRLRQMSSGSGMHNMFLYEPSVRVGRTRRVLGGSRMLDDLFAAPMLPHGYMPLGAPLVQPLFEPLYRSRLHKSRSGRRRSGAVVDGYGQAGVDSEELQAAPVGLGAPLQSVGTATPVHAGVLQAPPPAHPAFLVSAAMVERAMFVWVDRFFHEHGGEFAELRKCFEAFKLSFTSERVRYDMARNGGNYDRVDQFFVQGSRP